MERNRKNDGRRNTMMKNKWVKAYNGPFTDGESQIIVMELKKTLQKIGFEVKRTKRPNKQQWDIRTKLTCVEQDSKEK